MSINGRNFLGETTILKTVDLEWIHTRLLARASSDTFRTREKSGWFSANIARVVRLKHALWAITHHGHSVLKREVQIVPSDRKPVE